MMNGDGYRIDQAVRTFFAESRELLESMESSLLAIEKGECSFDLLNAVFRAAHTIKGSSGMFGFGAIERFTHRLENLLDALRTGAREAESGLISLLLECKDHLDDLLNEAERSGDASLPGDLDDRDRELLQRLDEAGCGNAAEEKVRNECWHISLRFGGNVFRNGMDPQSFITYLKRFGAIRTVAVLTDGAPSFAALDPESCYLGFEIDFSGEVTKEQIEEVFDFVREDCDIRVLPPRAAIGRYIELIRELPEEEGKIGELLRKIGTLTDSELAHALAIQGCEGAASGAAEARRLGDIVVEEGMAHRPVVEAAMERQESIRKKQGTMRIDAEKLDTLINLVGELVITGAGIRQLVEAPVLDRSSLVESASVMARLIEYIRESSMSLRMVPIGETFRRFERVVRDLGNERGKEIDLVISGGETELDKSLIEKIADPLMHLVRNSLDHGITAPAEREARGKPRRGAIRLNAFHETGNVVIEVSDDGEGLDRDRIFARGVETGMLNPDAAIADDELYRLIFEPGFSTASEVTNISGRGVGMDVVRKNIEELRGTVTLSSVPGKGIGVRIVLPLTLSIIDGFMFQVGESYYVVPLEMVLECLETTRVRLDSRDGGQYLNLRGKVLPFLKLRDFFGTGGDEPEIANVIVVRSGPAMAGLVVDRLIGELQTVIKPLGPIFNRLRWTCGSTILGTGEVALILDVPNLIKEIRTGEGADSALATSTVQ